MGKLFDLDSPFVRVMNKVADLMLLNILTLVCCLPIVTVGASLTACHYVALKIKRNEEGYITRDFFKSFKMNFKQATVIWLLVIVEVIVLIADFYIIKTNTEVQIGTWFEILLMIITILTAFTLCWVFATLAKFSNTVKGTLKNALALSMMNFPKTITMIVCYVIPVIILIFFMQLFPFVLLFGFSAPVFVSALMYDKNFKQLEEKIYARIEAEKGPEQVLSEEDDERIFTDMSEQELEQSKKK